MKRYLVDVNVWVALVYQGHVHNVQALRWFGALDDEAAVFCRITQIGLLRSLTNPAIMGEEVCSMRSAWSNYRRLEQDARFAFVDEPHDIESAFRKLASLPFPSTKLWTDAYLAAFANAAELSFATFDRGFATRGGVQSLVIIE